MNGIIHSKRTTRLHLLKAGAALVLGMGFAATAMSEPPPVVGSGTSSQHVFLNFSGGQSQKLTPTLARQYMSAIDPGATKQRFVDWLVNAGFIGQPSDWAPNGQQVYTKQTTKAAANPATDYGPGKVNAFAHIIILNSADLGFIRNQYIRCKPDCVTPNAKIYTYLENYGPTQFAALDPITGLPVPGSDTTNTREAVTIALERRSTDPRTGGRIADVAFEWAPAANGTNPTHNFGQIYAYFVAAHEPVPFDAHNTSDCDLAHNRVVSAPRDTVIDESYFWPDDSSSPGNNQAIWDCKFNLRATPTAPSGDVDRIGFLNPRPDWTVFTIDPTTLKPDVFAPELDSLGTKMMPSLCSICHGGNIPSTVTTSTTPWGTTGEIQEFKMLPADAVNSVFGCDDRSTAAPGDACQGANFNGGTFVVTSPLVQDGTAPTTAANMTRAAQEIELKKYNQAVTVTQGARLPKTPVILADGSIGGGNWSVGTSPSHALQVLFGWYQAFDGDYSMSASPVHQNDNFVPIAWRGTSTAGTQPGTVPVTPSDLYLNVVARNCRSCHLNREASLDFRSERQFSSNSGNIRDYVFQPECDQILGQVNPENIVMPLAKLTWERLWNGINPVTNIANDGATSSAKTDTTSGASLINKLKQYFGYTPTSYCASQH
jgi:hypothetical protein